MGGMTCTSHYIKLPCIPNEVTVERRFVVEHIDTVGLSSGEIGQGFEALFASKARAFPMRTAP